MAILLVIGLSLKRAWRFFFCRVPADGKENAKLFNGEKGQRSKSWHPFFAVNQQWKEGSTWQLRLESTLVPIDWKDAFDCQDLQWLQPSTHYWQRGSWRETRYDWWWGYDFGGLVSEWVFVGCLIAMEVSCCLTSKWCKHLLSTSHYKHFKVVLSQLGRFRADVFFASSESGGNFHHKHFSWWNKMVRCGSPVSFSGVLLLFGLVAQFFLILLPFTKTQNTVIQPVFRWFFSWTWEKLTISGVSRSTTKRTLSFIGGNRLVNDVSPDKVLKKAGGPKESPWSNLPYWRPAWCEARYHVQKAAAERGCLKYGRGNWIE